MKNKVILLIIALLAIGSLAGFLVLNQKIEAGDKKIAAGEYQVREGEQELAQGKNKLSQGEQQLSQGQTFSKDMRKYSLLTTAFSPVAGVFMYAGHKMVHKKIDAGELQVATGKQKIQSGEIRLAQGISALKKGIEKLSFAKKLRAVYAFAAVFFTGLFIVILMIR